MTDYLWFILEANLLMALFFGIFKLIQRFLSFGWQRFSLLSIPVLSVLVLWIKQSSITQTWSVHIPVMELDTVTVRPQAASPTETGTIPFSFLEICYWLGLLLLASWTLYNLYQVLRTFLGAKRKQEEGFTLIELPDQAPASFFRFIQLPEGLPEHDREIIFQHEKIHARKLHSADRLFIEAVHCSSWFNPLILLIKKELVHIHEFEVDRIMYNKYRVGYMEFLLAYTLGTSSTIYSFTNQFMTRLTLIKRIKIMKNNSKKVLIAVLALPLIAGTFTLISFTRGTETSAKGRGQAITTDRTATPKTAADNEEKALRAEPVNTTEESTNSLPEKRIMEKEIHFVEPAADKKNSELPVPDELLPGSKMTKQETEVDKLAEYVGGSAAMTKYLVSNLKYPEEAVKSKTTGKVIVSFVVTKDGKVTKATVKRGVSKELDQEAVRVVSSMPNWIPAEKDGKKVDSEMILPVAFAL